LYNRLATRAGPPAYQPCVARGDEVKSGQLLFTLERESEASAVRQAEKNLAQSQSQLDDLMKGKRPTEIASLEAQLQQVQANLKLANDDFARREQLLGTHVISREELDAARMQRDADQAQVDQLSSDLETAKLGGREDAIRATRAAVESQQAALDKAKWSFDQKRQFAPTNAFCAGHAVSSGRMGRGGKSGRGFAAAGKFEGCASLYRRKFCRKLKPARR